MVAMLHRHALVPGQMFVSDDWQRTWSHRYCLVASCLDLQGNQQLQQQVDMLRQEASDKATSFGNQAQALTAEKTALQQELIEMSQKLKVAESGKSELQEQQDLWKSKCSKYQLVGSSAKQPVSACYSASLQEHVQAVMYTLFMPISTTANCTALKTLPELYQERQDLLHCWTDLTDTMPLPTSEQPANIIPAWPQTCACTHDEGHIAAAWP